MSNLPQAVQEVGQLHFEGNIIPHTWYQHITYDNGKPNVNAIVILSDILYWYRPSEIRDEQTGQVVEYRKKFAADKLQRNYTQIANQFGFTKKQARDAVNFLVDKGLITKELRTITTKSGLKMSQVMYLEPVTINIKLINFPAQVTSDDIQVTPDDTEVTSGIPESYTYTETPTEISTESENTPQDFIDTVVNSLGKTSDETAPNPEDQYWTLRDKFLKEAQRLNHPDQFEKDEIIKALEQKQDFEQWKSSIQQTGLNYKGQGKIARAIEVYLHGDGDYEKWRQWKYPDKTNGNHKDRADFVPKKIRVDKDGGAYF